MVSKLLSIRGLTISYRSRDRTTRVVRSLDLDLGPGETVALVGDSGSGKSTTALAITGLLPPAARIEAGEIWFEGKDLAKASSRELRQARGARIGLVPQDPAVSLNPVQRVGAQVAEALVVHRLATRRSARNRAVELLAEAGLDDPAGRAGQYPHELSGGMLQRVLIAIALAARPRLIIADEATSALDVTVQRRILDHIEGLTRTLGTAVLLVTHDLEVAAERAARIAVLAGGELVETAPTAELLRAPGHAQTKKLLASAVPVTSPMPARTEPLVVAERLVKTFSRRGNDGRVRPHRAVDGVDLTVHRGETLALVGESGSGKTTTARLLLRLADPTSGLIFFDGEDITNARGAALRAVRRRSQLIYQNPYESLDPRLPVEDAVTEPLRMFRAGDRRHRSARARELLGRVALPASFLRRRPAELSGGQRQRVAIARALALSPDLVVCDEPVSALDVTVQAQVLELLAELQADTGVAYLFISHDLAVVRQIAHRTAVLRSGRIVEIGPTKEIFSSPADDYTRELLAAIPRRRRVQAASDATTGASSRADSSSSTA